MGRQEESNCNTEKELTFHYVMTEISVKLLIDKEQKRVVFAEAESDFVDVLFSFLALPLGRIVHLLGKQSGMGSLDSLYKSVEQLDAKHLKNEACKEMLLKPRSAAAIICEDLKIKNIHDVNSRAYYVCNESDCLIQSPCYYTYLTKARCSRCGKLMDNQLQWLKGTSDQKEGIFLNDGAKFIVTDDLRVMPISVVSGLSLLEELRINDASILEERVINVGNVEALKLLRSLESKHALTEAFLSDACVEPSLKHFIVIKDEINDSEAEHKINVKIILNKKNNSVLYAEVGGDFLNQLLSFLTFPLGSVFRLLNDHTSQEGCISNLYTSAESLGLEWFKSKKCKNMVVFPQLASHYGCEKQMLQLVEMTPFKGTCSASCLKCYGYNGYKSILNPPCKHGLIQAEIIEQNPKLQKGGSGSGGGFVQDSKRFMIADNLHISLISPIPLIMTKEIDFCISDIVEKEVILDKAKVLYMLGNMLISKTVLTDVFTPKQKKKLSKYHYYM